MAKTAQIFSTILSALTALIDFKILIDIPSFYELSEVYIEAILISAAIIISLIAFGISFFIKRKSLAAQENRHKIRCFKLYLESANKNEIVSTMQSNPKYFYDIFPYAYVLGLTSIYSEHFKNVPYKNPAWCKCDTREYTDFYAFANHLLRSMTQMLTHSQKDYYRINYRSSVEHDAKLLNEWINS